MRLAVRQRGIVTTRQMSAAGLDSGAIRRRVIKGWLHPVFRGVYRVGMPESLPLSTELAAVLACGPGTVVSGRSAAKVWGLAVHEAPGPVEVTVTEGAARSREGLSVRRRPLEGPDITKRQGIPITRPAKTLLDLAGILSPIDLERAVAEAKVQGQVSDAQLRAAVKRAPRGPGTPRLRHILDSELGAQPTRSELERRLLELLRAARLPEPECNVMVAGCRPDFLWRAQRVAAETDGWRYHRSRARFERDHANTNRLKAEAWEVLRFTWRELQEEPFAVVALIARALGM